MHEAVIWPVVTEVMWLLLPSIWKDIWITNSLNFSGVKELNKVTDVFRSEIGKQNLDHLFPVRLSVQENVLQQRAMCCEDDLRWKCNSFCQSDLKNDECRIAKFWSINSYHHLVCKYSLPSTVTHEEEIRICRGGLATVFCHGRGQGRGTKKKKQD